MNAVDFHEANTTFGPPADLDPSQCKTIRAFRGVVPAGSLEGAPLVVTAWKPTVEEIGMIVSGHPVYLSILGELPPHFITAHFQQAINPA